MLNSGSQRQKMAYVWHRHSSWGAMGVPQYCNQAFLNLSTAANPTFLENVDSAAFAIWALWLRVTFSLTLILFLLAVRLVVLFSLGWVQQYMWSLPFATYWECKRACVSVCLSVSVCRGGCRGNCTAS